MMISPLISLNNIVTCRFRVTVVMELAFSKGQGKRAETIFKKVAKVKKKVNFKKDCKAMKSSKTAKNTRHLPVAFAKRVNRFARACATYRQMANAIECFNRSVGIIILLLGMMI
jgi:hypothetical protein